MDQHSFTLAQVEAVVPGRLVIVEYKILPFHSEKGKKKRRKKKKEKIRTGRSKEGIRKRGSMGVRWVWVWVERNREKMKQSGIRQSQT